MPRTPLTASCARRTKNTASRNSSRCRSGPANQPREGTTLVVPLRLSARSMGFSIEQYAEQRPTLWHLTHRLNLDLIRLSHILRPADALTSTTSNGPRRGRPIIPGTPVLRDQDLLHEKNIAFEPGSSMSDLLRELNSRVFFWSGWADRPVKPGRRALLRYRADILIRVPFLDLVGQHTPNFSCCNSGAPRMQLGKPAPRGPSTFLPGSECEFPPSNVVEVTFAQTVWLPPSTQVASSLVGPWEPLFPQKFLSPM